MHWYLAGLSFSCWSSSLWQAQFDRPSSFSGPLATWMKVVCSLLFCCVMCNSSSQVPQTHWHHFLKTVFRQPSEEGEQTYVLSGSADIHCSAKTLISVGWCVRLSGVTLLRAKMRNSHILYTQVWDTTSQRFPFLQISFCKLPPRLRFI